MGDEQKYPPGFTPHTDTLKLPKGFTPSNLEKKKEVGGVASLIGGEVGSSNPQSQKARLSNYLYGLKTEDQKKMAQPSGGVVLNKKLKKNERPFDQTTEEAVKSGYDKLNELMYSDDDRWKDPVKALHKDYENNPAATISALGLVQMSLADSGLHAKKVLADTHFGTDNNNLTTELLKQRADQYDRIAQPFRDIQFTYENKPTDSPEDDYNAKDKIYDAAIRAYANANPMFSKQAEAAGLDLNGSDLVNKIGAKDESRYGSAMPGQIMNHIINDTDFLDYIQNENPKLFNAVKSVSDNLLTDQRAFGVNVVANEISRERQKLGFNNPIVEFDDKQFRRENDLVAEKLYADDPVKMKLYRDEVSQNADELIDTPALLNSFANSAKGVYKGIGNTFSAPVTSIPSQIYKGWEQQANQVSAEPKGFSKFASGTGNVLGLVAALGGVSNVLGAGGAGFYSSRVVPFLAGSVPFAGDFWHEGVMKYPNNPTKAGISAGLQTILYGALSQKIFPAKEVEAAFSKIKPEVGKIVESLATNKITKEAAKQQSMTLLKKAFSQLGGGVKNAATISAELTAIQGASSAFDYFNMSDEEFKNHHPQGELADTFKSLFLDNLVLGNMTKYSEMRRGNKLLEESLYEAATNQKRYKRVIDEMEVTDPTISKEDMIGNLEFLSKLKAGLDRNGVSEKNQKRYLLEAAKERAIKKELSALPESNITRRGEDAIKRGEEIKSRILNGEESENIITKDEQKQIDEAEKSRVELERLTKQNELDNQEYEQKRKELDGRNPDDRLKIARLEQWIKEKNEDFKSKSEKLSTEKKEKYPDIDMGSGEITKPIELSIDLPEGYGEENKVRTEDDELLEKFREKTATTNKGADLQYFIDKAAEDPGSFMETFGIKLTRQALERVPIEALKEKYDFLIKFGESETSEYLKQVISERESKLDQQRELDMGTEPVQDSEYMGVTGTTSVNIKEKDGIITATFKGTRSDKPGATILSSGYKYGGRTVKETLSDFEKDYGVKVDEIIDDVDEIIVVEERAEVNPREGVGTGQSVTLRIKTKSGDVLNDVNIPVNKRKFTDQSIEPSKPTEEMSDSEIENRMMEIEDKGGDMKEFNRLEKEMEKRERATVFSVPLENVSAAVDALVKKDKEQPNGYGSFIERRDASETKAVAERYLKPKLISDAELKNDFKEAVMGNPDTWYADGLKLRESLKEAANRGIDTSEMVAEVEKEFVKDGYTSEDAKATVARKLSKIFENSQKVETDESKLLSNSRPTEETPTEQAPPEPPVAEPPIPSQKAPDSDPGGTRRKGILGRLYEAKNVPQTAKEGFERVGLDYTPSSQEEAAATARGIVEEMGVDEAVGLAERGTFDGDVNSLIFAESLNKLYEEGQSATTPEGRLSAAERFKDVAIAYDKAARSGGRFGAAINHFYKKSPLGVVLYENEKRKEAFNEWAKSKDKSWEEFYGDLMKIPEFAELVNKDVQSKLKAERVSGRAKRIQKVRAAFADAKNRIRSGGSAYSTIIPPHVMEAALEAMELAYEAGEAVVKIIDDAIKTISDKIGSSSWDKDKFRSEWEEKLSDGSSGKRPLTDEELKVRVIDKFRKRLKGLNEKQKDDIIRRSYNKLIDNGALDYADMRDIISNVTGRGEMTDAEAAKMKELVQKTNAVEDAAKKLREERTKESQIEYTKAQLEAAKANKELQDLFYNKPDITKRLTSIMQLSTLGIPSLVNNPIYNFWNQLGLRFPIGLINDLMDRGLALAAKAAGKNYEKEYNIIAAQKGFWEMLGVGSKEAFEQITTGLNRQDYLQKELYGQNIRPFKAMRDLWDNAKGKKKLTPKQKLDKGLQATVGVPAEIVARLLNLGDKPQRFGAEGATAAQFADALGLKNMDYDLFLEFPREEAYRAYKALGYSDAEAGQKADYIKDSIVKEGQRSTFQQDNLLNDALTKAFSVFGGKESGYANLAKTLTVSPYVKIPTNAFWSMYNLLNPEIAMIQAMVHGGRSKYLSNKGEVNKSKLQLREARYWAAHAMVGIGTRAVVISLLKSGVFTPSSDDDDSKKERDASFTFDKPGTIQVGDQKIAMRWFGQFGMLANQISKKYRDSTPEQRENQDEFWNMAFGGMELQGLSELQNGVFANSSALFDILGGGNPDRYITNTINMFTNIIQPASIAQINRAALDEVPTSRGDGLLDKINQEFAKRSTIYRWATGTEINKKRDLWGQTIPKGGNIISRSFGISKADPKMFARPIYDDYLRTANSSFLPPAVLNNLNGQKLNIKQLERLEEYIGQERKKMVGPYVNDMAQIQLQKKKYSELDDEKKVAVLQELYKEGRSRGLEKFYTDFPEFRPKEKSTKEIVDDDIMEATKQLMKLNK